MRHSVVTLGCCAIGIILFGCRGSARSERASDREKDMSGIAIVSGMDCEFYLTDALGRRTGLDPAWEKPLGEIPRSAYFEEAIEDPEGDGRMENRILEIMGPETGEYRLTIVAVAGAECDIYIRMYDKAGEPKAIDLENIPVAPGTARHYTLTFNKDDASSCALAAVDDGAAQ